MTKYTVKRKRNGYQVSCILEKGTAVSEREKSTLTNSAVPGTVPMLLKGKKKLVCQLPPEAVLLREILKAGISNQEFFSIVGQALSIFSKVRERNLKIGNLLSDWDTIFYDRSERTLLFLYAPLDNGEINSLSADFVPFFRNLAFETTFQSNGDDKRIQAYVNIVSQKRSREDISKILAGNPPQTIPISVYCDMVAQENASEQEELKALLYGNPRPMGAQGGSQQGSTAYLFENQAVQGNQNHERTRPMGGMSVSANYSGAVTPTQKLPPKTIDVFHAGGSLAQPQTAAGIGTHKTVDVFHINSNQSATPIQNAPGQQYQTVGMFGGQSTPSVQAASNGLQMNGVDLPGWHDRTTTLTEGTAYQTARLIRTRDNTSFLISGVNWTFGRDNSLGGGYIPANETISFHHGSILQRQGKWYLVDNDSSNHTYVNGRMLSPHQEQEIRFGDIIQISDEKFRFDR